MKWGNFGRRLDAHAFAARFVKSVVGRAPDVEVRLSGPLALRLVGRDAKQTVHLDNAFAQYQSNPGALDEILKRWVDGLIAGLERAPTIDPMKIVPIVKGRYWIERQRADHLEQFGAEAPFDLYWEPYNTCLIVAYAEFNESLRFVHSGDLERSHLDVVTVREQSLINLRRRTQDWRATGGDDRVVVICADGNLEPSLILLNEVWDDPRVWVDGARLATIAERGFAITAGATNIRSNAARHRLTPLNSSLKSMRPRTMRCSNYWRPRATGSGDEAHRWSSRDCECNRDSAL